MSTSLLLDPDTWDLLVDAAGNMATAITPYAVAQDVACAIRTFRGEVRYNTAVGVPYFDEILGKAPPVSLLKQRITEAAKSVDGVVAVDVEVATDAQRQVTGQVQVTTSSGVTLPVNF